MIADKNVIFVKESLKSLPFSSENCEKAWDSRQTIEEKRNFHQMIRRKKVKIGKGRRLRRQKLVGKSKI